MPESEKQWLIEAMESLTVDEAKRMREIGEALRQPEQPSDASQRLQLLDELSGFVESLDNAKDVFVVGGFAPLLACVAGSSFPEVRAAAAGVVTTVVQNNPKAQEWALQSGALLTLASGLAQALTQGHTAVAAACVTALSSLVRDCKPGQVQLLSPLRVLPRPAFGAPSAEGEGQASATATASGAAAEAEHALSLLAQTVATALVSLSPAACAPTGPQRRLLRKSLFALRHLVVGPLADRVKAALLTDGVRLLSQADAPCCGLAEVMLDFLVSAATVPSPDLDVDTIDSRASALHVLLALAGPTEVTSEGVVDETSDRRQPVASFTNEAAARPTAAPAASAPVLAVGDMPSDDPNADAAAEPVVVAHVAAPKKLPAAVVRAAAELEEAEEASILSLDQRRTRMAGLAPRLEALRAVLAAVEASLAQQAAAGGEAAEAAEASLEGVREEAGLAREIAAYLGTA
jgi:hypothetical protein